MSEYDAEDLLKKTRSKTDIRIRTQNFPDGESVWEVSFPNDRPDLALLYNNLAYDLVAAVVAKLGVEYSKFLLDQDRNRLNAAIQPAFDALSAGTTMD